ncbi:MAG: DUF4249 family protein [Bacteroidia bacterium]|nr:DUF4249 family protein [Bacteroidia bacterium]
MDTFVRPNLPEKLCSIGIIDADDTARYISFEKSYQSEYPEEINDSLRELSFSISTPEKEIFNYHSDQTMKDLLNFKIPDSIAFISGETYILTAREKTLVSISADIVVPEPPSQLNFISVNKEITTLSIPQSCSGLTVVKSVVASFSFINNNEQEKYYALIVEGAGSTLSSLYIPSSGLLDFTVRETNYPGFFAEMFGLIMYHYKCNENFLSVVKSPVFGYFIDGTNTTDKTCTITISTQFSDTYSVYDFLKAINIKVLSIPEELYFFEKSLYTYKQTKNDPFSEPVYLNGNIKGGNGVFTICRSRTLSIDFPTWY